MKIENLDYANVAILKADTLVKNSKTFAHSNDPGDNQRGLRELHRAAEEQVTALKELSSAIEKLRKALED